jgi:hypothetical protein
MEEGKKRKQKESKGRKKREKGVKKERMLLYASRPSEKSLHHKTETRKGRPDIKITEICRLTQNWKLYKICTLLEQRLTFLLRPTFQQC